MINQPSKFQTIWIHSIVLSSPLFFRTGEEGISALDIFFAIYFFGSLIFWFFWKIFIKKEKIVRNIADFLLLIFPLLSIGTVAISLMNGISWLDTIREYVMFTFLLYYFPIRENMTDKDSIIKLGISFSISVLANDIGQFYDYYHEFTKGVRYAYQIIAGQRINQTVFTFSILSGILFFLYPQKKISRIWIIFVVGITTIALISTSSRTFWLIVMLGILIYFIVLPFKQKILLILSSLIASLIIVVIINLFFQDKAEIVYKALTIRLTSSTEGKKDVSVTQRLIEYKSVLKKIEENPIGGNGFSKRFIFYNTILQMTLHSTYIHNGYLFFIYRYGFPLAGVYFFIVFYFLGKSIILFFKINDMFIKFLVLAGFSGLMTLTISSISSAQFMNRDGIFILAISYALVEVAYSFYYKKEIENQKLISGIKENAN